MRRQIRTQGGEEGGVEGAGEISIKITAEFHSVFDPSKDLTSAALS